MGLADDYMKQVNQYDSGKPNTAVPSRGKTGTVIASNAAKPRPYAPEARPAAPATSGAAKAVDLFNNYSEFSGKNAAPSRNAVGAPAPAANTKISDANPGTKWLLAASAQNNDGPVPPTFRGIPSTVGSGAPNRPQTNPADLNAAENQIAAGRTLGSGITLSQTATGEVAAFGPDGKKIDLKDPETRSKFGLPTGGSGQPGVVQRGSGMSSNFTGQFDHGAALFEAQMAALNRGERLTGPQGAVVQNTNQDPLQSRRDALQSKLDAYGDRSGLFKGGSFDDLLGYAVKTSGTRQELKRVDQEILGRHDLSNKIQLALLGNQGMLDKQALDNKGALMKQLFENQGTMDVRTMMEGNENLRSDKALASSLLGSSLGQKGSQKDHVAEFKKSGLLEGVKSIVTNNPDLANNPEAFSKILDSMAKGAFGGNEKVKGAVDDLLKD